MQALKQSVAGSMKAIPTANALETLRQAGYSADQAGLEAFQKRMAITSHLFSGVASKDAPTINDVHDIAARALDPALGAKEVGITLPVIMNALKAFRDPVTGKPLPPAQIKKKALEIQTQAATTSEILHQHSPQVNLIDNGSSISYEPAGTRENPATGMSYPKQLPPTTPVATPGGRQYQGAPGTAPPPPFRTSTSPDRPADFGQRFGNLPPAAEGLPGVFPRMPAAYAGPGAAEPPGSPSAPRAVPSQTITQAPTGPMESLRPGYVESAKSIAEAGAMQANSLSQANDSSMTRKAMLGNLEDDLSRFTAGGGADWTRVAKNWANRNFSGAMPESWTAPGGMLDPKSVASQEQFNKQAAMLAQQQFGAIGGTGTDAKFNSAFTTSPNETLSQLGNKGIIQLLKGNEDAIQAKNKAWNVWRKENGPDTYADFSQDFNDKFDPRAFQFKYMTKTERNDYMKGMEPEERERFVHDLAHAHKQGWVKF